MTKIIALLALLPLVSACGPLLFAGVAGGTAAVVDNALEERRDDRNWCLDHYAQGELWRTHRCWRFEGHW